jgi:UDPglucose 6-dehydrogenase
MEVIVYEPALNKSTFLGSRVVNYLRQFKQEADVKIADVIVAIRMMHDLSVATDKIYSRDLLRSV